MRALVLLFFGSGLSALIYEVVWFQVLRLTLGSTQTSVVILLISFMGGMYLGSLFFHRMISEKQNPIRIYAFLEIAIGASGLFVLFTLPIFAQAYLSAVKLGLPSILFRSIISILILLPPTVLMGATLPAIARWTDVDRIGASKLAYLYASNILGAVMGTLVTGFYLLRYYDVRVASYVAVSLNLLIAIAGFRLSRRRINRKRPVLPRQAIGSAAGTWVILWAIGISGFASLGLQIVWMRLLAVRFGMTVYTFVIVLTIFLLGLCIGSVVASTLLTRFRSAIKLLALSQLLLIPAIGFGEYVIRQEQIWTIQSSLFWRIGSFDLDAFLTGSAALLPATILWGASLPFAISAFAGSSCDPSKTTGSVYAFNTLGGMIGIIMVSIVLLPTVGSSTVQLIIVGATAIGVCLLLFGIQTAGVPRKVASSNLQRMIKVLLFSFYVSATIFLTKNLTLPISPGPIAYGRETWKWNGPHDYIYVEEGINTSIAVSQSHAGGDRYLHIGGKVVASTALEDMRLQRLLAHTPALMHEKPRTVLVIGLGSGVTAGSFVHHKTIRRIVIVEIEEKVAVAAGEFFGKYNNHVLEDPRTQLVIDDARHFLATTDEHFDVITADPIHPWVKGSAALYTKEFFELIKSRLSETGLVTQWVPLYETNEAAVKSEVGTFLSVFDSGSVWNSQKGAIGYDLYLLSRAQPMAVDGQRLQSRIDSEPSVGGALAEVGINSVLDILESYVGNIDTFTQWAAGYEPNLDINLRLEYLAGTAISNRQEQEIFNEMTLDLAYPEDLFEVEPNMERKLRTWFAMTYGNE